MDMMEICVNYVTDQTLYNLDKIDNFMIKNLEENKVNCVETLNKSTDKWLIVAPLHNGNTVTELQTLIEQNKANNHASLHLVFIELNQSQSLTTQLNSDKMIQTAESYGFDVHSLTVSSIETSIDLPLQVKNLLTLLDFLMKIRK
jgi:hypothetical protein